MNSCNQKCKYNKNGICQLSLRLKNANTGECAVYEKSMQIRR